MTAIRPRASSRLKRLRVSDRAITVAVATILPVGILILWEITTQMGWIKELFLPSLSGIVNEFFVIVSRGYAGHPLAKHVGMSLFRVFTAFFLGSFIGTALGLLMGHYKYVKAAFYLITELLRPIPPLAFITLFILWFGIGEVSKVMIILYAGTLIVMINTIAGVQACPKEKILAAKTLGANDFNVFWLVILPAALPYIFTGMRVALSVDFGILVASELLAGDVGIGFIIQDASTFFNVKALFVGIFMIGFFGVTFDFVLRTISQRIVHWEGK